ncbi:nitroreductase [Mycobacterium sp. 852002-51971_SCH5477799-a]|nr:nitroreductase [Mycobacterium sp. 852002-51971_SCH5477799-a]
MKRIRQKGGKVMGMDALVLTTIGRKSGAQRSTPVAYFPDGDDAWLVVASANGAANNPAWYYNIAAHPDRVRVELSGRKVTVGAQQLHGEAREDAWRRIKETLPRFAKYEQQTDRELPVIRLRARSATDSE